MPRTFGKHYWLGYLLAIAAVAPAAALPSRVQAQSVLEFRYTPVTRAQVAIWVEDASGKFLATVALTEATAFRGIGNRPGASEMNSGYRWPYGRREGVLPIWAHRRAEAAGAQMFARVIFQNRVEGFASQTQSDQSRDQYYCLQFDTQKSSRDELDAVSCATMFNSDKGRYATQADISMGYSEPFEARDATTGNMMGAMRPMPLKSVYPPRMDTSKCPVEGACFDGNDVANYAKDARAVMPDIDAVTKATAPGDTPVKLLFTVPKTWLKGDYVAWIEVNVEGDYNEEASAGAQKMLGWNDASFPPPSTPDDKWDYYAKNYGYAYRGQPSIAFKVPFKLGDTGEASASVDMPAGRSSWNVWESDYGKLETVSYAANDPLHIANANGSGADRLRQDSSGHRFSVAARVGTDSPTEQPPTSEPTTDAGVTNPDAGVGTMDGGSDTEMPPPDTTPPTCGDKTAAAAADTGAQGETAGSSAPAMSAPSNGSSEGVVIRDTGDCAGGPVGPIDGLSLRRHSNKLRDYEWIMLRFKAAKSQQAIHEYEVKVSTEAITDDASFERGRPARNATTNAEGATALMLPTDVPAGQYIDSAVGDLIADTHYFVAVRATDEFNQHGPISVAEINTPVRTFATVTPCFIATAAYGSPLASEIGVLRRFRDRYLSSTAPGRAIVAAYQEYGPRAARVIARDDSLRSWVRSALAPVIALVRRLP